MARVLVLHNAVAADALPDERDVLVQAAEIAAALEAHGHFVRHFAVDLDLRAAQRAIVETGCEVVFNLVESLAGSGRLVHVAPALLETLAVPCTGAGLDGMFLTSNKVLAKHFLRARCIPTPDWSIDGVGLPSGGAPWIVKPVWEEASLGIDDASVVSAEAVAGLLASRRRQHGGEWFAERYVAGRELNVALLAGRAGPVVLPVSEIGFDEYPPDKPRIVGYAAKWNEASFEYGHTPRRFLAAGEAALGERLAGIAKQCWSLFGLRGYARVDFRVDERGEPWVLEVNANPCLAADAGYAAALAEAGLDLGEALERILEDALERG